jgi:hypothetical protein
MLPDSWIVTNPQFTISPAAKTFAPGNLRATRGNEGYRKLIDYYLEKEYTLRFSGGLVPDVYHILVKGQSVLVNASSAIAKAKLRLVYELAPIALMVEASGRSSYCAPTETGGDMKPISILDVKIDDLDQRLGVCFGSLEEVERFKSLLFPNRLNHCFYLMLYYTFNMSRRVNLTSSRQMGSFGMWMVMSGCFYHNYQSIWDESSQYLVHEGLKRFLVTSESI